MFELTDAMTAKVLQRRREGCKYSEILREFEQLGWSDPTDTKPPYRAIRNLAIKHGLAARPTRQ